MKTKIIHVCAGAILLLSVPALVQAQNLFHTGSAQTQEVSGVVEKSRDLWIAMFPADDLPSFGFENQQELRSAVPGAPIPVFHSYRNQEGITAVQSTGEFFIPLLVNNETRAFLTVAYFEDRFTVVSAGEMNLAKDAASFISRTSQTSRNTKIIWLRDLNQQADFIAVLEGNAEAQDPAFTPLFTAQRASFTEEIKFPGLAEKLREMTIQPN